MYCGQADLRQKSPDTAVALLIQAALSPLCYMSPVHILSSICYINLILVLSQVCYRSQVLVLGPFKRLKLINMKMSKS